MRFGEPMEPVWTHWLRDRLPAASLIHGRAREKGRKSLWIAAFCSGQSRGLTGDLRMFMYVAARSRRGNCAWDATGAGGGRFCDRAWAAERGDQEDGDEDKRGTSNERGHGATPGGTDVRAFMAGMIPFGASTCQDVSLV
jgi:hypothetical protein